MAEPDLSEFVALSKPTRKPCAVCVAAKMLKLGDRTALEAACATERHTITSNAIRLWLDGRGHVVSVNALTAHRDGKCNRV